MISLKCKICGGSIQLTGESHGICDSCGSEVTLPRIDNEKKAEFYNRANYFRAQKDFDRAYSDFEHMIAEDIHDAEAYWSLVLCKYGITYEQDVRTEEYLPTVSRMSLEPILEDPDYLKALENSDTYTKGLYREEANKIARIQDKYLEISRREEPYDVFICFKAEEDNGERTVGSVIAQDIYEKLTERGLKVFFSRITLEHVLGQEYEPYIFAALHSAKIMLLVSNNPRHLQSPWVKNEWSRFLKLTKQDPNKRIIPVFKNMDIFDFPEEIPTRDYVNAGNAGYLQDLTRGVLKILGKEQTASQAVGAQDFINEAADAISCKNFKKAELMSDQALTYAPENGYAHYYHLLAKYEASELDDLFGREVDWANDSALKRISMYGDNKLKDLVAQFLAEYNRRTDYSTAKALMAKERYPDALVYLERLGEYRDAAKILVKCRKLAYHQKMLQEYRQETENDVENFLHQKIQTEHPKEYKTFASMLHEISVLPRADASIIGCLICAIIMLGLGIAAVFVEFFGSFCAMYQIFVGLIYGWGVVKSKVKGFFIAALSFIAFVAFVSSDFAGVGNVLVGLIPLLKFIKLCAKERKYSNAVKKMENYEQTTIQPLEQSISEDMQSRYGEVLTPEEMGVFVNVRERINATLY